MSATYTCPLCGSTSANPNDVEQGYCGRCHGWTRTPMLTHWVIYDHPRDFPSSWVMREWFVYNGLTEPVVGDVVVAPSLDGARMFIPPHAYNLGRAAADDVAIMEVWV